MKKFLIVGQGIAGTTISILLEERGHHFDILDQGPEFSSSAVAAGLINPVTGKRMLKTWKADLLLPFAFDFYTRIEKKYGESFLHPRPIYKIFSSIEEQNTWSAQENVDQFIDLNCAHEIHGKFVKNPYKGFQTKYSGNLDIPTFLAFFKKKYETQGNYIHGVFDEHQVDFKSGKVIYATKEYDGIILCHGNGIADSELFKNVLMKPNKGNVLTLKIKDFNSDSIYSKGIFLMPLPEKDTYKCGSTYSWDFTDALPEETGRKEILDKLHDFLDQKYEVTEHKAGVRPSSRDRRPILGSNPVHTQVYIFNGLGTKGVSLAPYFASQLIDFIENKSEIDKDVDCLRFYKNKNR